MEPWVLDTIGGALADRLVLDQLELVDTPKDVLVEDEAFQPPEPEPWNDDEVSS